MGIGGQHDGFRHTATDMSRGLPATVSPVLPTAPLTNEIFFSISSSQPVKYRGDMIAGHHSHQAENYRYNLF